MKRRKVTLVSNGIMGTGIKIRRGRTWKGGTPRDSHTITERQRDSS